MIDKEKSPQLIQGSPHIFPSAELRVDDIINSSTVKKKAFTLPNSKKPTKTIKDIKNEYEYFEKTTNDGFLKIRLKMMKDFLEKYIEISNFIELFSFNLWELFNNETIEYLEDDFVQLEYLLFVYQILNLKILKNLILYGKINNELVNWSKELVILDNKGELVWNSFKNSEYYIEIKIKNEKLLEYYENHIHNEKIKEIKIRINNKKDNFHKLFTKSLFYLKEVNPEFKILLDFFLNKLKMLLISAAYENKSLKNDFFILKCLYQLILFMDLEENFKLNVQTRTVKMNMETIRDILTNIETLKKNIEEKMKLFNSYDFNIII